MISIETPKQKPKKEKESEIISGRGAHRSYEFVNFKDNN
jgi:hypothetical protein